MIGINGGSVFDANGVLMAVREAGADTQGPMEFAANAVVIEAQRLLQKGARKAGQKRGPPSAPGTPPHAQSSDLHGSIDSAPYRRGYIIGPRSKAWYGRIHEFGGRRHPKRPFMRPALRNMKRKYAKLWKSLPLARTQAGRRLAAKARGA